MSPMSVNCDLPDLGMAANICMVFRQHNEAGLAQSQRRIPIFPAVWGPDEAAGANTEERLWRSSTCGDLDAPPGPPASRLRPAAPLASNVFPGRVANAADASFSRWRAPSR